MPHHLPCRLHFDIGMIEIKSDPQLLIVAHFIKYIISSIFVRIVFQSIPISMARIRKKQFH